MKRLMLSCALVLMLAGTAQAIPFTISLAGSDCTWCTDGALTLDYTPESGYVFAEEFQDLTADYLGSFPPSAGLSTPVHYFCMLASFCGGGTSLYDAHQNGMMEANVSVLLATLSPSQWSLSFSEFRWVPGTDFSDWQRATITNVYGASDPDLLASVPEPSAWLLLALGIVALGGVMAGRGDGRTEAWEGHRQH